jgi:hypothetical protein
LGGIFIVYSIVGHDMRLSELVFLNFLFGWFSITHGELIHVIRQVKAQGLLLPKLHRRGGHHEAHFLIFRAFSFFWR